MHNEGVEPPPSVLPSVPPGFSLIPARWVVSDVRQVRASGGMVEPSMPLARRVCMGWMECMCIWQELAEDDATAEGTRLCIRMADYIRKVSVACCVCARMRACFFVLYGMCH